VADGEDIFIKREYDRLKNAGTPKPLKQILNG